MPFGVVVVALADVVEDVVDFDADDVGEHSRWADDNAAEFASHRRLAKRWNSN